MVNFPLPHMQESAQHRFWLRRSPFKTCS